MSGTRASSGGVAPIQRLLPGALQGGQILRVSTALSCLLGLPLRVQKIRAGRSTPGLRYLGRAGSRAAEFGFGDWESRDRSLGCGRRDRLQRLPFWSTEIGQFVHAFCCWCLYPLFFFVFPFLLSSSFPSSLSSSSPPPQFRVIPNSLGRITWNFDSPASTSQMLVLYQSFFS